MVFEHDAQKPYEFIWLLNMMFRIPMNLYVVFGFKLMALKALD